MKAIGKKSVQMEEEKEEGACVGTVEDEDEGYAFMGLVSHSCILIMVWNDNHCSGWLSTKLQHGGNGIHKESSTRVDRMKNDPSSAALSVIFSSL